MGNKSQTKIKVIFGVLLETKFLRFFFSRIRASTPTDLANHPEFKFVSDCGVEKNFIRVDATPFVFTSLEDTTFGYNNTGFNQEFRPESLYVASDGRLYHGFKHKAVGFGLVKSSLADLIRLVIITDKLTTINSKVIFDIFG